MGCEQSVKAQRMDKFHLTRGKGRTKISLLAHSMGHDLVVCIFNKNAHLGAMAVGEYDHAGKRTSISVITRLGHKDDVIAEKAAYLISKHAKSPSCVIAGVHLDNITDEEIQKVLDNASLLVDELLRQWDMREASGKDRDGPGEHSTCRPNPFFSKSFENPRIKDEYTDLTKDACHARL